LASTAASSLPELDLDPVDAFITAGMAWAATNRYTYSGTYAPNPTPLKAERMEYEYDTASDTSSILSYYLASLPELDLDPVDTFITAGIAWAARNRYTYNGKHVPTLPLSKAEKTENEYESGTDSDTASETSSILSYYLASTAASSLPELDPTDTFIAAGLAWAAVNRHTYSGTQRTGK